jgi:hypothetical protein
MAKQRVVKPVAKKSTKRQKPQKVESLLGDVEDLLTDEDGPLSMVEDDAVGETPETTDTEVSTTAPTIPDEQGQTALQQDSNATASDDTQPPPSERDTLPVDASTVGKRVPFEELVALYKSDPATFTVLACEYTARMMMAQEQIAGVLGLIASHLKGLDQTSIVLVDLEMRKMQPPQGGR